MNRTFKHIILPALASVALIGLYFTPLSLVGCVTRGWIALAIVGGSLLAALATVGIGLWQRVRGVAGSVWWVLTTIILMVPALLLLGPLG